MITLNGNKVVFEKFPNGETRFVHNNIESFLDTYDENVVTLKYTDDSDLIKLMFLKNYLDSIGCHYTRLSITYMPYSRMDRSENGSPFTLKYVANFINNLKFYSVTIFEPHSDVTPALINDCTSFYINFELIELVKKEVGFNEDEDYIMFPDAGASKRYSKMKAKNVLIGNKVRDFRTGEIKGLDLIGNTVNTLDKKVIIVDDLSSYGGTFVHSAKRLAGEGFKEIYLLVTHAENSIFKGELFNHIDKVFTTNSILTEQNYWNNKKFEKQLKIYEIEGVLS